MNSSYPGERHFIAFMLRARWGDRHHSNVYTSNIWDGLQKWTPMHEFYYPPLQKKTQIAENEKAAGWKQESKGMQVNWVQTTKTWGTQAAIKCETQGAKIRLGNRCEECIWMDKEIRANSKEWKTQRKHNRTHGGLNLQNKTGNKLTKIQTIQPVVG